MKTRTAAVVLVLLFVVALGASVMLYPSLPARMPTHWDLHGNVNGWSSRLFGALALLVARPKPIPDDGTR